MAFWLKIAYSRPLLGGFGGIFPPNDVIYRCNHQKALPCTETCRLSHKAWKSVHGFDLGAGSRKKGQDRTVKKVTKALYFTYLGRSLHWTDFHKNLHSTCRPRHNHVCKLLSWNFQGLRFYRGRTSRFPIDSVMGLLRCLWLMDMLNCWWLILVTAVDTVDGVEWCHSQWRHSGPARDWLIVYCCRPIRSSAATHLRHLRLVISQSTMTHALSRAVMPVQLLFSACTLRRYHLWAISWSPRLIAVYKSPWLYPWCIGAYVRAAWRLPVAGSQRRWRRHVYGDAQPSGP